MYYIIYIIIVVFLLLTGLYKVVINGKDKSKKIEKIGIIIFCTFTVFVYYNSVNAIDSNNYQVKFMYNDSLTTKSDILFTKFIEVIKIFTNNYNVFRGLIGIIYLIPIVVILKLNKKEINIALFLFLCMVFPYFQSIVALRYTIASTIAVLAIYYFMNSKNNLKNVIITILLIFISAGFHDTCILLLPLYFVYLLFKKIKQKKFIFGFLLVIDVILIILLRLTNFSDFILKLLDESNSGYIITMKNAGIGFAINFLIQMIYIGLLSKIVKKQNLIDKNEILNKVLLLNYSTIIFIPFYAINTLFFRLFRCLLIFNYYVCAKYYKDNKKDILLSAMIILGIICMIYDANGINSLISILE